MADKFAFDHPNAAIEALGQRLSVVAASECLGIADCVARVLAEDVVADRSSPAADVSAMDGYAVRMADLQRTNPIAVSGECAPGNPPPKMQSNTVVRIFTGAVVPNDCELVIKREDTEELEDAICFRDAARRTTPGENIRRAGENAPAGSTVVTSGSYLTAAQLATLANFGCYSSKVYRAVRVAIITTGDEVGMFAKEQPQPWQLRNSNRVSVAAVLRSSASIETTHLDHCLDDRDALTSLLHQRIDQCDAVLMTGGVSMGDYDYVPEVIQDLGGQIVFHGLPLRPGKPILGAATKNGRLILGLPGNPVSATVSCRRFAIPLLGKISGRVNWNPPRPLVRLDQPGSKTIPLYWMRLVRLTADGLATPVISQGSGDLVSLGQSSGFVEVPPGRLDEAAWPYYSWD